MKRKQIVLCALMLVALVLAGCSKTEPKPPVDTEQKQDAVTTPADREETPPAPSDSAPSGGEKEETPVTVIPLPATIDMEHLENCTLAVSLEKGGAYVDDTGVMQMDVTVYTYDLYDMVDIAQLEVGSRIELRGEMVEITALERTAAGMVRINGGLDAGGYDLWTNDSGVFFETGYSDVKTYYELGKATLRVSTDFVFTDSSNLDADPTIYYPGDFLTDDAGIDYDFTPHNTSIVVADGEIVSMERVYTP